MSHEKIQEMIAEMAGIIGKAKEDNALESLLDAMLTPAEIEGIHMRWTLMKLLTQGMTQREIQSKLGICLGKISRGSRMLKYDHPEFNELIRKYSENNADIQK